MQETTSQVIDRFIQAFQQRDAAAIPDLVGEDCVMEGIEPAPDGVRVVGREPNVRVWQAMVRDTSGAFENEQVLVLGDWAINRWRYATTSGDSLRGVTLLRVEDGKIVEARAYAKRPPVVGLGTADVIRRFNDAFRKHDPSALPELVGPDCIIENTAPAPDGARIVGRQACLDHWTRLALDTSLDFELEGVHIAADRATILWRLHFTGGAVRGVNLMRVDGGLIVEALGYVKH
ncbi:MAG TPA: nuclear transport factor 2 family protein [Polyangiaceae bacterium]|nr:nuclear transport factor 2 family protein [Polyangiaceae bacterium]